MRTEAEAFAATHISVLTECVACGGDCRITALLDETGIPSEHGLCDPCNVRITAKVQRERRADW